ncbi:MAG: hypothetical protein U0R24_09980 [Solirubrobacterales bacterium]
MNDAYEQWNHALVREYFPPGGRGQLAYLPVDDEELAALADHHEICDPADASAEFVGAVKAQMRSDFGTLGGFANGVRGWRRVRDEPPYVGALAVCVLAASRMDADESARVASHNYYVQLNRLLGRDERAGMPSGFDRLVSAWLDLGTWLEEDCSGTRGASTIRTNPHHKYIGYPLSQCLLRAYDRHRLPDFFKAAGLAPRDEISDDRLFLLFQAWASHPGCGLSNRALRAVASAKDIDRAEIAETVQRELQVWDGALLDERGRRRGIIRLSVIQSRRGTAVRLVPERLSGFPEDGWTLDHSGAAVELLTHVSSDDWFQPLPDNLIVRAFSQAGLKLINGRFALSLDPPADAIPCRQAALELGGYLSQAEATLFEPHVAIVRTSRFEDLRSALANVCNAPLQRHPSETNLPPGWTITSPFQIQSIPEVSSIPFPGFRPRLVAAMSLQGGLRLGEDVYLAGGGEPDAHIASEVSSDLTVELDERREALKSGTLALSLREMALEPGLHILRADVTRRFTTVETFGDVTPRGAGELGHLFERHTDYHPKSSGAAPLPDQPPRGHVALSGASLKGLREDLPVPSRLPILARSGGSFYAVLGASPQEVAKPATVTAPSWLRVAGLEDYFQFVEISCAFDPVWLLTARSDGEKRIAMLGDGDPAPVGELGEWGALLKDWANATVDDEAHGRWLAYLEAAEAHEA